MFQCYDYFTTAPPKINLKSFFVDLIEGKNMKKSLEFLNYGQNIFDYMYNRHYATLLVSSFRNYQPFSPLSCEFHFFNLFSPLLCVLIECQHEVKIHKAILTFCIWIFYSLLLCFLLVNDNNKRSEWKEWIPFTDGGEWNKNWMNSDIWICL